MSYYVDFKFRYSLVTINIEGIILEMQKKLYTEDFKKVIVDLFEGGVSVINLHNKYGIAKSTIYAWAKYYSSTHIDDYEQVANIAILKKLKQAENENKTLRKIVRMLVENDAKYR